MSTATAPVTDAEMLDRARALLPRLRARADECDSLRQLPMETVADLQEAGFFRMIQPKRWGGLEVEPETWFEAGQLIATACPSTAWVLGVVGVHAWQLALFDAAAQEEVWGDDSATLVASSYMPVAKVKIVDGGYRISGRWSFSSGCDHCSWSFLGGFVPPHGEFNRPDMRTFLLPRADYTIVDNWNVSGLKGTGSKDVVVDDAFVPEHRTHRFSHGFALSSPGNALNDAPLFRIPFGQLFTRTVANPATGMLRGALDSYLEITSRKIGQADGSRVSLDPAAQEIAANARATIDEINLVLRHDFAEMMRLARAEEPIPVEKRVQWRYHSSRSVVRAVAGVDDLFTTSGGRALFDGADIRRYFLDAHAARAHYANNPSKPGRNLGRVLLGLQTEDWFI